MKLKLAGVVTVAVVAAALAVAFAGGASRSGYAPTGLSASVSAANGDPQTLRQAIAVSKLLGPVAYGTPIQIVLSLRSKHPQDLQRLFVNGQGAAGGKPSLVGPSTPLVEKALVVARQAGFQTSWVQGDGIASLKGTPASVRNLFDVKLSRYQEPGGRIFYAGNRQPVLPQAFKPVVTGLAGLDDFFQMQPQEVTPGGATPTDMLGFYNVAPLRAAGLDGAGETVVLPENINPTLFVTLKNDLARYSTKYGLPAADISVRADRSWAPFASGKSAMSALGEADLDVEVIHAIAPKAKLVVYLFGSGDAGFIASVDAMVRENPTGIISYSYGGCEQGLSGRTLTAYEQPWLRLAAENMSAYVSSGDSGAYMCGQKTGPWVSFPADIPVVASVGGTTVFLGKNGGYGFELAWGEPLTEWGGGGGVSKTFARPSYQTGAGYPSTKAAPGRLVPDVAANSWQGWNIVGTGASGAIGGTSAAAPFWAGLTALFDQDLVRNHLRRLGIPLTAFTAIARKRDGAFHDITSGNNLFYDAGPGWDAATGWGTPDAAILDRDIKAYIKAGGK